MAVVVEPVVTAEKLIEVLAEACEQPALDYKRSVDLRDRRDVVEIAKDVGAMQSLERGGYIVVGADDRGKPVGTLSEAQARSLDEANLRPALRKYIPDLDVRSAWHQVDGAWLVLIYVAPSPDGWCVFAVEGTHQKPGQKPTVVFRAGEVFTRHGTSSERWQQRDIKALRSRVIARHKEEWRQELRAELRAQGLVSNAAQQVRQRSASSLTWQLDEEVFDAAVLEYLRADDDIPLRQFLLQAPVQAGSLIDSSPEDFVTLLNRVASLGAAGLVHQRNQWTRTATDALVAIYNLGDRSRNPSVEPAAQRLWITVLERVYGLGGLAVRMRDWTIVRYLADRRGTDSGFDWFGSWLRHGLTEAARANMLTVNGSHSSGLIAAAHNVVREVAALHPDTAADNETILNSLCQFDALGALVVISARNNTDDRNFYTNFARYRSERTEPALITITQDAQARTTLFAGDDELLKAGILNMLRIADYEGSRYMGWSGIQDQQLRKFLATN
ncbi:helix-turn-helix domain-containing protein [Streptomyces pilosus]|uniref:AlbA family DNA-binding domain-containing protein n=1 Tax=Streptomyces pilosus TaxID=28893 RepID=UPI0036F94EE3